VAHGAINRFKYDEFSPETALCYAPQPRSSADFSMPHAIWIFLLMLLTACAQTPPPRDTFRVATFNMALNDDRAGGVIERLRGEDPAVRKLASIIQRVRPDVILLNEIDFDEAHLAADLFQRRYLEAGADAIRYPYRFIAPVNTGVFSGIDLNGDGVAAGAEDAFGYGQHPGQYGMLLLSMFPIDSIRARTFQKLRWQDMPNAERPHHPDGRVFQADTVWSQLRLSSKSHWDVPIKTPQGVFHLLASHPTPPVFDGDEDRNGRRNHDEIRFWADYVVPLRSSWIIDDQGVRGGLPADAPFVIAGDLNADPLAGASFNQAINQLLKHRLVNPVQPRQMRDQAQANTASFGPVTGEMRVDYVLPARTLGVLGSGVFWPAEGSAEHAWIDASDHRLVWVDLRLR